MAISSNQGVGASGVATVQGITNALSQPAFVPDGTITPLSTRFGKFNEQFILNAIPTKHMSALSGQYYTVTQNAGIAVVTSLTSLTEASPAMIIENTGTTNQPNVLLDFVRIQSTAIAAAATELQFAWKLDNIRGKWASGGTQLTPANCNMGLASVSVTTCHFGALVVNSAQQSSVNARLVGSGWAVIPATAPAQIIGQTQTFQFGSVDIALNGLLSNVASAGANTFPSAITLGMAPVVLMPGTTATLFLWGAATASAASYQVSAGWYEY